MSERVLWKVEVEFWTDGDLPVDEIKKFVREALERAAGSLVTSDRVADATYHSEFDVKHVHSATKSSAKPTPPAAPAPTVKRRIRRGE